MTSQFDQQFSSSAAPQLQQQFGVLVQWIRPGVASATFTASFASLVDEVEIDGDALGTGAERRRWWIQKADCVLDSQTFVPRPGDVLQLVDSADAATGEKHEVAPSGSDRAVERHPDGLRFVVRTKRIADG